MSHDESKSNKEEIVPFGGYKGGALRWRRLRKQRRYNSRYKDNEMMRRILSTRISN